MITDGFNDPKLIFGAVVVRYIKRSTNQINRINDDKGRSFAGIVVVKCGTHHRRQRFASLLSALVLVLGITSGSNGATRNNSAILGKDAVGERIPNIGFNSNEVAKLFRRF